jgi:transcription antitermination factor NusG
MSYADRAVQTEAWYAFYTEPRRELVVRWAIKALGFDAYVPTFRVEIRHGRKGHRGIKSHIEHRPAFTRYVFARFDITDDQWGAIGSVKGLLHPVTSNGQPCRIPDEMIEEVKRLESIGFFDRVPSAKSRFERNDDIRVSEGVFSGLNGKFVADHGSSVEVLMEMLGGARPVKLPLDYLERA